MKISVNTSYELSFNVECHYGTEGGMESEYFGGGVKTIEEAIQLWELACVNQPSLAWLIVCEPSKSVKRGK